MCVVECGPRVFLEHDLYVCWNVEHNFVGTQSICVIECCPFYHRSWLKSLLVIQQIHINPKSVMADKSDK